MKKDSKRLARRVVRQRTDEGYNTRCGRANTRGAIQVLTFDASGCISSATNSLDILWRAKP